MLPRAMECGGYLSGRSVLWLDDHELRKRRHRMERPHQSMAIRQANLIRFLDAKPNRLTGKMGEKERHTFQASPNLYNVRKRHFRCKIETYSFENQSFDSHKTLPICLDYL
jgi:hypothetical protein